MKSTQSSHAFLLAKKGQSNEWRRDGKGHRFAGDAAGSWFRNRRFRYRKVEGPTVERLQLCFVWLVMPGMQSLNRIRS